MARMRLNAKLLLPVVLLTMSACSSAPTGFTSYCLPHDDNPKVSAPTDVAVRNVPEPGSIQTQELGDPIIRRARFYKESVSKLGASEILTTYPVRLHWQAKSAKIDNPMPELLGKFDQSILSLLYIDGSCKPQSISAVSLQERVDASKAWIKHIAADASPEYSALSASTPEGTPVVLRTTTQGHQYLELSTPIKLSASTVFISEGGKGEGKDFYLSGLIKINGISGYMAVVSVRQYGITSLYVIPAIGDPALRGAVTSNLKYAGTVDGFFDQTLLYNGISGSTVRFLYREYSGDINRANFSQDIQYDLNADEIVGFKGARFRIIEASNTQIKYQVIEPFSADFN